ncbi:MAG: outer membrane beta-barrel family protein [Saonia sp.]
MRKFWAIAFLLFLHHGIAQKSVTISGTVTDAVTGTPIAFANITLLRDGKILDGTISDADGRFQLKRTTEFSVLEISFIGYSTVTLQRNAISNMGQLNISLQAHLENLKEVVINGERTATQQEIDRKIIHLGADLQQVGTTALEAFDQIPEIQTDLGTGTISLRGSDNVRLLVNGKRSPLTPAELLAQLSSAAIDRVEIITSPSAKHQADGISGIINIILKNNNDRGLHLGLHAGIGTRRYAYGLQGNYNKGFLNFRFNASQTGREMNSEQRLDRTFTNGDTQSIFTPVDYNGLVRKLAGGLDLFIDPDNELSVEVDYTDDFHSFFNRSAYFNVTNREDFALTRNSEHAHYTTIFNTNYRRRLKGEAHFLELDYNLNNNRNDYPASDFEDETFLFSQKIEEDNVLHALALDYSVPISKSILLEVGGSWNKSRLKSQRAIDPNEAPSTTDFFEYNESLLGSYGLTKYTGDKLRLQAGLRFEHFTSNSFNTLNDTRTNLNFSNLFPSLHFSYNPNELSSFNIGYSKRVSRPNLHHINPFQLGTPQFRFDGNPDLKPELSDNIEFSYEQNGTKFNWSAVSFYRYRKDIILWIENIEDNNIQVVTFENQGINHSLGAEATLKYRFSSFWDSSLAANYYYTLMEDNDVVTWDQLYSSSILWKNTFRVSASVSTDITYRVTPKRQNAFDYIATRHRIDWALRVKLLNNTLTINLRVVDVLDNNLLKRNTIAPGFTQRTVWRLQSQTFGYLFSVNYKLFENEGKTRKRKNREYLHNDLSN